jgi:hypothetical protein
MFAVDPPKIPADRKDGKHKGQFASNKMLKHRKTKLAHDTVARRACFFNFLASQQKVKTKIPLRSLRLERRVGA